MPTPRQDIPELAEARAEVDKLHQLYLNGIRQKLRNRLENPKWTIGRIAKRAGMSAKQVSEILNDRKASMSFRTVIALAHGMGRAPKDLLARRE